MIYKFTIAVDYEHRKTSIRASFVGDTIYALLIDADWKAKVVEQIDLYFSDDEPFAFSLYLKSDKAIDEFKFTDRIISIVRSYLYMKRHPFG